MHFGRPLAHFWLSFASRWLPFASRWLSFGALLVQLGSLLVPLGDILMISAPKINNLTFQGRTKTLQKRFRDATLIRVAVSIVL